MENSDTKKEEFRHWCVVELFGRTSYAGLVSSQVIGTASFVRVDVPEINGTSAFTKLFGEKAIYAITPTTKELAVEYLKQTRQPPVNIYLPVSESSQKEQIGVGSNEDDSDLVF